MNYPIIYVLDDLPVIGEMGNATHIEYIKTCETCHKKITHYKFLSYKFDIWRGEDLIKGAQFYLVSERLKQALDRIKGLSFTKVGIEKADSFKIIKSAYQKELPNFYKMDFKYELDGPDRWWNKKEKCSVCGDQKWDISLNGIKSMLNSSTENEYIYRAVYKKSWKNEDAFLLKDYGPPIITENLLNIIKRVTKQKISLKEAEWV